jgi:hypothetical protein
VLSAVAALLGVLQFVVVRAVYVKTMVGHFKLLCSCCR